MAPIRKYRSVNAVSPSKGVENVKRNMPQKRNLSDLLGSQWSKEELEYFYEAYRKYGKDWKKVAAAVRNRSVDMVEALYMTNRAYLSLPEGIASAVGFIAMMTDYYCNMVKDHSDPESSDGGKTSRKSQEKLKSHLETATSEKKPSGGTQPRTIGKRKSRFPVSFSVKTVGGGKCGSPPVSQFSNRRKGNVMSLPSWSGERIGTESEWTSAKHLADMDEDGLEKGKRIHVKKSVSNYVSNNNLDGIKEASGGTEKQIFGVKLGKIARHIAMKNSRRAQESTVGVREKKDSQNGAPVTKTSNLEKGSGRDDNGILVSKIPRAEFHTVTHLSDSQEAEARDAGKITSKGEHAPFSISQQKQEKKWITYSKRKKNVQKDMLTNCLSNKLLRQWCVSEWFYSAIDYPWFARREFVEYLKHVGLGHVSSLNRVEWGIIRSSLGKPRRFSEQFLKEEKEKLSQYRKTVKKYYTELREGIREGLPTDIARPLSVGQRVMAIHPKRREIHNANVLTVDNNGCRVQFERQELGVEFVKDIDCMPLNFLENMPVSLAREAAIRKELSTSFFEIKTRGQAKNQKLQGDKKKNSGEISEHVDVASHLSPDCHLRNLVEEKGIPNDSNLQKKVRRDESGNDQKGVYSALVAQMQAKEDDTQALAELARILKKKEMVVSELQRINDVIEKQRDGDNSFIDSEYRKKQHASFLVQLDTLNDQVSRALRDLRQHNTYHSSLHRSPSTPKL